MTQLTEKRHQTSCISDFSLRASAVSRCDIKAFDAHLSDETLPPGQHPKSQWLTL